MLNHRLVKRGRKTKVEYLLTFVGYGPENNLWQDDVENCEQLVKDYWLLSQSQRDLLSSFFHLCMLMVGVSMV